MSSNFPSTCPELGIEVPISAIDLELRKLWEQDEARTNSSLMNLVVYSEKSGSLLENSRIINELTRDNACRAILVEIDRNEVASLAAVAMDGHGQSLAVAPGEDGDDSGVR